MDLQRILKYALTGLFIGFAFTYALLILLAFMFGSDSIGSLKKSILVVTTNPEWMLETPHYAILFAIVGLLIAIIVQKYKK